MEQIKRLENGAIDTAYYIERSHRLRGRALGHFLGKWLRTGWMRVSWQLHKKAHLPGQTSQIHQGNGSDASQ